MIGKLASTKNGTRSAIVLHSWLYNINTGFPIIISVSGLAVLFYAVYYSKLIVVNGLESPESRERAANKSSADDYFSYYQGVNGKPGVDFPIFAFIPKTLFSCKEVESGYYADLETDCQVFHICNEGRKVSFLCPNGTIFQQSDLICEWWFKVNCTSAPYFYEESAEQLREETLKRKESHRVLQHEKGTSSAPSYFNPGAIYSRNTFRQTNQNNNYDPARIERNGGRGERKLDINSNNNYLESQVPEESASFYKNTRNNIQHTSKSSTTNPYPNHRETYSDIKNPITYYYSKPYSSKLTERPYFTTTPFVYHYSTPRSGTQATINTEEASNNADTSFGHKLSSTPSPATAERNGYLSKNAGTYSEDVSGVNISTERPEENTQSTVSDSFYRSPTANNEYQNLFSLSSRNAASTTESYNSYIGSVKSSRYGSNDIPSTANTFTSDGYQQTTKFIYENNIFGNKANLSTISSDHHELSGIQTPAGFGFKNENQDDFLSSVHSIPVTKPEVTYNLGLNYITSTVPSNVGELQNKQTLGQNKFRDFVPTVVTETTVETTTEDDQYAGFIQESEMTTKSSVAVDLSGLRMNVKGRSYEPNNDPVNDQKKSNRNEVVTDTPYLGSTTYNYETETLQSKETRVSFKEPTQHVSELETSQSISPRVSFENSNQPTKGTSLSPPLSLNPFDFSITIPPNNLSRNYTLEISTPKPFTLLPTITAPNIEINSISTNFYNLEDRKSIDESGSLSTNSASTVTDDNLEPFIPTYKLSSASPFITSLFTSNQNIGSNHPTLPTPVESDPQPTTYSPELVQDNVNNMMNTLKNIIQNRTENNTFDAPRPGLIIPPSAGPQTLHSLAIYFANALDNIAASPEESLDDSATEPDSTTKLYDGETQAINSLLTHSTLLRYNELFHEDDDFDEEAITVNIDTRFGEDDKKDLDVEHSNNPVQSPPRVRQLARVFTEALSSYLDDPYTFKKVLEEVRPTEPPRTEAPATNIPTVEEEEVLNYSDADIKPSNLSRVTSSTTGFPPVSPTWGYILALNNSDPVQSSVANEIENLQSANTQSFVSHFNNLLQSEKLNKTINRTDESSKGLSNHWTSSADVTKLWQKTLYVSPHSVNENLDLSETTDLGLSTENEYEGDSTDSSYLSSDSKEINYEIRTLPKVGLNSTEVHGLLIDFMNSNTTEGSSKLQRILQKLNTTESEFLTKMKEIETNPLTRRLILLLISECESNKSKDIETRAATVQNLLSLTKSDGESLKAPRSSSLSEGVNKDESKNSLHKLVHPTLEDEDQDTRALQLLNSLYVIASKYGK